MLSRLAYALDFLACVGLTGTVVLAILAKTLAVDPDTGQMLMILVLVHFAGPALLAVIATKTFKYVVGDERGITRYP